MPKKKIKPVNNYMKYAGWGTQLFVFLFLGFFVGQYLDSYLGFEKPFIGISFAFIVLGFQFYKLIKELS